MTEADLIALAHSAKSAVVGWVFANFINAAVLAGVLMFIWKTYLKVKIDESVKNIYANELERLKADLNTRLEVQKSELVTTLEETKIHSEKFRIHILRTHQSAYAIAEICSWHASAAEHT